MAASDPGAAPHACRATLQHIALLGRKRAAIAAAQDQAEEQYLHRIAAGYADGSVSLDGLSGLLREFRAVAGPGWKHRWNAAIGIDPQWLAHHWPANGPGGSWEGPWPLAGGPRPRNGASVAYVLFDAANVPCYVGSTHDFGTRLHRHETDGKEFTFWRAHPCADRDAAYALESRLLAEHKPYLNKRAA